MKGRRREQVGHNAWLFGQVTHVPSCVTVARLACVRCVAANGWDWRGTSTGSGGRMTAAVPWRPWRRTHSGWRATTLPLVHALGLLASRPPADEEAKPPDRQRSASLPRSGAGAAGDAFHAFFRAHHREIFGYLWRITADEHARYDLAQ